MRVLWVGDAAVATGFARCTHAACDALHAAGHEVAVLGLNYRGDPHAYPYPIYPCWQPFDGGRDAFGITRLPRLVERFRPDVVVLTTDPWHVSGYLGALKEGLSEGIEAPPVVGWLAVDGKNQHGTPLNGLAHVVTWTEFAAEELVAGGYTGPGSVVPLGVDLDTYKPGDGSVFRRRHLAHLPEGAFLVGAVGRNQQRKRLDLTIEYFAAWLAETGRTDAWLYLHCAPTGEGGFDLDRLANFWGVASRTIIAQPPIGQGWPESEVADMYRALDLYVTTSQGEGWGLPALEAMACGVPVVAPEWSGLGDWAAGTAQLVPCSAYAATAPLGSPGAYTIGGVPDRAEFIKALDELYAWPSFREQLGKAGRERAEQLPWKASGRAMLELLEQVIAEKREAA